MNTLTFKKQIKGLSKQFAKKKDESPKSTLKNKKFKLTSKHREMRYIKP